VTEGGGDPVDAGIEGKARAHDVGGTVRELLPKVGMGNQPRQRSAPTSRSAR